ncbi:hypothetical protein C1X61_30275, partial [Pseudomonas sp. FW215-T2]
MAMALTPDGRTEAVFGRPLHALSLDRLHHGFLEAAADEADRRRLEDARTEALALGEASVAFRPSEAPDNVEGGRLAARRLISQGRRQLAFLGDVALPEI